MVMGDGTETWAWNVVAVVAVCVTVSVPASSGPAWPEENIRYG